MGTQSLLENLTYGSGKAVQESVIWSLCQQLGLPEYFFSAKGGTQEMGKVSFVLSPAQRQLVCLVRSIICAPDVLLVHGRRWRRVLPNRVALPPLPSRVPTPALCCSKRAR